MKEIFEQYGGVMITVTAIVAVVAVLIAVIGNASAGGAVYDAFSSLLNDFWNSVPKP